jgi:hypothetical protein
MVNSEENGWPSRKLFGYISSHTVYSSDPVIQGGTTLQMAENSPIPNTRWAGPHIGVLFATL